jgi:hypothetical protein
LHLSNTDDAEGFRKNLSATTESTTVSSQSFRANVLVELYLGKEKEFCEEILEKGLVLDSKVKRTDFVHGSYDLIYVQNGESEFAEAPPQVLWVE